MNLATAHSQRKSSFPLPLIIMSIISLSAYSTDYYVKSDAGGLNDGTNWTNAFSDLQEALTIATTGDTVFVAQVRPEKIPVYCAGRNRRCKPGPAH